MRHTTQTLSARGLSVTYVTLEIGSQCRYMMESPKMLNDFCSSPIIMCEKYIAESFKNSQQMLTHNFSCQQLLYNIDYIIISNIIIIIIRGYYCHRLCYIYI